MLLSLAFLPSTRFLALIKFDANVAVFGFAPMPKIATSHYNLFRRPNKKAPAAGVGAGGEGLHRPLFWAYGALSDDAGSQYDTA